MNKYKIYTDYQERVDAFVKDLSDNDLLSRYEENRSPECLEFDSWDDSFQHYHNINDYKTLRDLLDNDNDWDEDDHNDKFNALLSQNYLYQAVVAEIINRWKALKNFNKTSFYLFHQNNSGGIINRDSVMCRNIIIEADSTYEANEIAENLGCYWNGVNKGFDCRCCGDRWYQSYQSLDKHLKDYELDTFEQLFEYLIADDNCDSDGLWGRIFYKNNEVKELRIHKQQNDN